LKTGIIVPVQWPLSREMQLPAGGRRPTVGIWTG